MLEKTFIHIPGIGSETERSLWNQGCEGWRDLLARPSDFSSGSVDRKVLQRHLTRSIAAIESGHHQYFRKALGLKEAWRAFPDFRHSCVYLDIETDGRAGDESITMIGLYDGMEYRCLLKHEDLANFPDVISHYSMIVTFFGTGFDLPMLKKTFSNLALDQIHLDLCPALKRLGVAGGLKKIEKQLGIQRSPQTEGLTGYDAVKLWRKHLVTRDPEALETLVAYNREDVVNMEPIAEYAYERLWEQATRTEDSLEAGAEPQRDSVSKLFDRPGWSGR